jgi:hypothetical protein
MACASEEFHQDGDDEPSSVLFSCDNFDLLVSISSPSPHRFDRQITTEGRPAALRRKALARPDGFDDFLLGCATLGRPLDRMRVENDGQPIACHEAASLIETVSAGDVNDRKNVSREGCSAAENLCVVAAGRKLGGQCPLPRRTQPSLRRLRKLACDATLPPPQAGEGWGGGAASIAELYDTRSRLLPTSARKDRSRADAGSLARPGNDETT